MKHIKLILMGAMTALALTACTPTEIKTQDMPESVRPHPEGLTPDMVSTEYFEKTADPNAVPMEMAFIYQVGEGGKLVREVEDVETVDESSLVNLLIGRGTLAEGTEVLSFETTGGVKAGPGVDPSQVVEGDRIGILNLSQVPEDKADVQCLASTFIENFALDKLQIQVSGEAVSGPEEGYFIMVDEGTAV